jgi:hypothetical protein
VLAEGMAAEEGDTIAGIHRSANAAITRHRVYAVGLVVVLVAVLLLVPEKSSTTGVSTGVVPSGIVVPPGETPPTAQFASGTTVGGVACGPGVLQVPWSAYAPPCQPAWSGDNGGATSAGVTAKTITVTYRTAATSQLAELYALVPPAVIGTNQEEIDTLQTYINAFNKSFELYGRQVKLAPFAGKGDFIDEDLGMDQAQAQEDAVTAKTQEDTFADLSLVDSSSVYATDLAKEQVVTSSLYENDAAWYQEYAPYEYTPGPNCTKMAEATAAILGKQLAGLPAIYAGDPALRAKIRTFGIIYPQNPQAADCAMEDAADMAGYGQKLDASVGVQFNLESLLPESAQAVAQMQAAGVTTVILSSADPITPTFLMQAADKDHYYPEWWVQSYFSGGQTDTDSLVRLFPADQIQDIIGIGNQTEPKLQQEAIVAYEQGDPLAGQAPIPSYIYTYQTALQFFDALQLAGPDLTPANFEAAMKRISPSADWGMLGGWNGSAGPFDPTSQFRVVRWDPSLVSPLDGKLGSFEACDSPAGYPFSPNGVGVPAKVQLICSPTLGQTYPPPAAALATPARTG